MANNRHGNHHRAPREFFTLGEHSIGNRLYRFKYDGKVYQILPETFNPHYRKNTLQFLMQLVVNDKNGKPSPTPSMSDI